MVDVQTSIIINRPREQVAEYAANPDHVCEWYVNIKSVEWVTPKPLVIDSQVAFQADFPGKQLSYIYQIVEHQPGSLLVMES